MLHGDMSSYTSLIEGRRADRGVGHGDSGFSSPGSMLFPAARPMDWLDPGDGSSAREHTRKILSGITSAMVGATDSPEATGPIPAAFTYFGQFVFHDMVFSRVFGLPQGSAARHHLKNAVSQGLDLSGLYGRGPEVDGHLYETPQSGSGAACRFPVGSACVKDAKGNRTPAAGRDLPRLDMWGCFIKVEGRRAPYRPLVADPRNDDNLILSQLLATLQSIHNRLVDVQVQSKVRCPGHAYTHARSFLISAYRHIVVHDYLGRLLDPRIWAFFFSGDGDQGRGTEGLDELPGLPLEFTFGASRFAHAMVRQFYTVNDHFAEQAGTLQKVLSFSSLRPDGDVPVEAKWVVDWKRFAESETASTVQHARRISPFLASELVSGNLATDLEGEPRSVAFMDSWRCYELGLPTGQEVARAIQARLPPQFSFDALDEAEMLPTPDCMARFRYHATKLKTALEGAGEFCRATPLSYYVLQEASVQGDNGSRLGPVGSYIVGATIAASLHRTANTNFFESGAPPDIDPATLAGLLALNDPVLTPDPDLLKKINKFIRSTGGTA